ncbi:MAG: hypothetical protein M3552_02000 [Planctomycetota bacterium]|nr:hypothetical protein [Planctomycetaceae bacterium]MDQ3329419.1 hypothetical protein [Planctomycetota bacterium]
MARRVPCSYDVKAAGEHASRWPGQNVLNLAMPSLADGLARLHAQNIDGFRNRMGSHAVELHRVA